MADNYTNEPMLDMFIYETTQMLEQLEEIILAGEKESKYSETSINEIFRIMHTIKGSSAMMMYEVISSLAHSVEDIFFYLRGEKPGKVDYSKLSDIIFECIDFIKIEVEKIKNRDQADGNATELIQSLKEMLSGLKRDNKSNDQETINTPEEKRLQYYISQDKSALMSYRNKYKATIYFDDGCAMENIRAYTIIHNLKDIADHIDYYPEDIIDSDDSLEIIQREGFTVWLRTDLPYEKMHDFFDKTIFLKDLELVQLQDDSEPDSIVKMKQETDRDNPIMIPVLDASEIGKNETGQKEQKVSTSQTHQSIISVSVNKLDMLMDLVGEMVIAEAMVIQNPDLQGLELNNFQKAARQLNKITSEMQDMVMSIRMVPLSATFQKMHRIIRDMCKKLNKEVDLEIIGENTEVDKNIIEHISDPLMHLVRNSIDHGIESPEERERKGKNRTGKIVLEAKNAGSDVLIIVRDNGKGLDKMKILKKAREQALIYKDETEMTDKEIFNLILLPGFSTKDNVSEFSGRGVGMDVVTKNIETVGGSVSVDSTPDKGTTITLKIPLTLAIIDGMNIKVGASCYTIPTNAIKESFRPKENDIITDPDGNEMIMVRGRCYPILRIHKRFGVKTEIQDFTHGIIIMVEQEEKSLCVFADCLLGQQQVVVKALPEYIKSFSKCNGLAGCTLLGDGSISLILDIAGLINSRRLE